MIIFMLEQGNHKNGFKELFLTDANGIFHKVELAQQDTEITNKNITQWQDSSYTYINYGHKTDFFRYKAIDLLNLKEKEDQ
jgi:hypothetical protein